MGLPISHATAHMWYGSNPVRENKAHKAIHQPGVTLIYKLGPVQDLRELGSVKGPIYGAHCMLINQFRPTCNMPQTDPGLLGTTRHKYRKVGIRC